MSKDALNIDDLLADLRELKLENQILRSRLEQYSNDKKLFSQGPVFTIAWGKGEYWPVLYASDNVESVIGFKVDEVTSSNFNFLSRVHKDDIDRVRDIVARSIENKDDTYELNYRFKVKNGSYRWFYDFTRIVRSSNGDIEYFNGYMFDQTYIKETEKELQREREKLQDVIVATRLGTWEADFIEESFNRNERWLEMLGLGSQDLVGFTTGKWQDLIHPEDVNRVSDGLDKLLKGENEYFSVEFRVRHKNGRYFWVSDKGKVIKVEGKDIVRGTRLDINNRKVVEKSLEDINYKHQSLVQNSPGVIFRCLYDNNMTMYFLSDAVEKLTGRSKSVFIENRELSFASIILDGDREIALEAFRDSVNDKTPINTEIRIVSATGETKWINIRALPIFEEEGIVSYIDGVILDVTRRKLIESELHRSQEMLKKVMDNVPEHIFWKGIDLKYLGCNVAGARLAGLNEPDQIIGLSDKELGWRSEDASYMNAREKAVLETGFSEFRVLEPLTLKDGTQLWLEVNRVPLRDEGGTINGVLVTFEDITDSVMIERELLAEKERFRTTILSIGDGVIATDATGNITLMNRTASELTEWNENDSLGVKLDEVYTIIDENTRVLLDSPLKKIYEDDKDSIRNHDKLLVSKSGRELPIEDSVSPIFDDQELLVGVVIVFRDHSEKRKHIKEIEYLSYHDQLTGLYNRRYYDEKMQMLNDEKYLPLSIILMDVNGLKLTNDAFGHQAGDKLLKEVSDAISKEFRTNEIIARIGGDEFVVVLPNTGKKDLLSIAKRIETSYSSRQVLGMPVSVSMGLATRTNIDEEVHALFKRAEDKMYHYKASSKGSQRYSSVQLILKTLFQKVPKEEAHSESVGDISYRLGLEMGLEMDDLMTLRTAAELHDIGKISIDTAILEERNLSESESEDFKRHSEVGYNILSTVSDYSLVADVVLSHHECYDGSGYPRGIVGHAIPLLSRIIGVADEYERLLSSNIFDDKDALKEHFKMYAGKRFDPSVVDALLKSFF